MSIMLIRSPMTAPLVRQLAGQHRVDRRWMHRDHARGAARASFTEGDDITGSRLGGASITDFGMRVRQDRPKSP